jgi:CelD/BcsL family acetyltransferase involved in cellulose biosynthesis
MLTGFRAAGLVASRYDHFGNWHQDLAGLDWPAYLALRPGALRETIRRRGRAAAKDPTVRIEVVRGSDRLDAALAAYETVYAKSWKEPEPYPRFNDMLLPRLAELGVMRLCVMWQGDAPLAAQYWTVRGGVATVLKLAHDDAARALSPGTILTAHMIKTLMEEDGVHALDFGRGDDPYKQSWTDVRRQRVGVVLINPRRPAGLMELARHGAGLLRRMVRDLRAKA